MSVTCIKILYMDSYLNICYPMSNQWHCKKWVMGCQQKNRGTQLYSTFEMQQNWFKKAVWIPSGLSKTARNNQFCQATCASDYGLILNKSLCSAQFADSCFCKTTEEVYATWSQQSLLKGPPASDLYLCYKNARNLRANVGMRDILDR